MVSLLYHMVPTFPVIPAHQVLRRMNLLQSPTDCMTYQPGLETVCLNLYSLQIAHNIYQADYGPLRLRPHR